MAKLCVCIEPFFLELDFLTRIKKIAGLGCSVFEFWYWDHEFDGKGLKPKKKDVEQMAWLVKKLKMEVSDIVVNSPDGSIGGNLNWPTDRPKYLARLEETINIAKQLNCKKLITCSGNTIMGQSREQQTQAAVDTLKEAAQMAAKHGIMLVLEALNSKVDHQGCFVDSSALGFEIVKKVGSPNLRLLYDIYHMQIMEGDILATIEKNINLIGHFHSAGVPGRHELDSGELNYPQIVAKIDALGYGGNFGLEYFPVLDSAASLKSVKKLLGGKK